MHELFFYRFNRLGICIYGCGTVLYTELRNDSQGIDLYDVVSKKWGIPVTVQILIHRGQTVNAVNSLADQGFVHGSNVFLTARARGGGKNDLTNVDGKSSNNGNYYAASEHDIY